MESVAKGQQRAMNRNLPNLLSGIRILAIPVIVIFLSSPGPAASFWAALVFSLASLTDLLDGYIARQQKKETAVGKLLDPMADKLLVLAGMIMLIPLARIPAWMAVLIIGREVAVTGLRGIASAEG